MSESVFGMNGLDGTTVAFLDSSAFDEKFVVELERDYIFNIHHVENKYHVPLLAGGYREVYEYACKHLIHPDDRNYERAMNPDALAAYMADPASGGMLKEEVRQKLVDGSFRWVQYIGISGEVHGVPKGQIHFYVFDIQNQRDRLAGASSINPDRTMRDAVTGLLPRELFVLEALELAKSTDGPWCCLALDIQNFKVFNLWFGQEQGTYLLCSIGEYLRGLEGEVPAVAAYFGRDNFGVFMRYDDDLIRCIYDDVMGIVSGLSNTVGFLPAIGVCVLAENEQPQLDIYDCARLMVAEAKKTHTDRIAYFDAQVLSNARKDYERLTAFQQALGNGEICFFVQPQCNIKTGRILGGEALVRWIKSDGRIVSPREFVPVLESTGLITMLDKVVWDQVCAWLRSLLDRGVQALPISINVSQVDILAFDVAEHLSSLVESYGIPASLLKVEVTESAYAASFDLISSTIQRLKDAGFSVLLDDFGSGYSSLNMLDKINVDVLKLDMAFMQKDSSMSRKGVSIVESIMDMARALEIPVVVEGLEEAAQVAFLKKLGCVYAQGFYFYRPMPIEQFEECLTQPDAIDLEGFTSRSTELFLATDFLRENLFGDLTLNRILGAAAFYALEGENLTITRFNEQFYRAIGDEGMDKRIENIQNFVPAEDHPQLYRALQEASENAAEGGSCEVRFWKSDDSLFWFRMQFYLLKDEGSRKLFFGQVEDISESREQSISFFEVLREQADATMRMDLDNNIIQYVTKGHTLDQIDLPSMALDTSIEQTAAKRIESDADRKAFIEFFDSNRLREAYRRAVYHEVLNIDFRLNNQLEPVEFSTYYIRYSKSHNQSLNVYAFARRRDRELLERDVLTGLGNRHSFNESMSALEGNPGLFKNLIVFSMDVNGLKAINDAFGHLAGDEVIRGAAQCIRQVMSPHGKCFRMSGDEFAAFVYGSEDFGSTLKAELEDAVSAWSGRYVSTLSVSCGYASADDHPGVGILDLIKAADDNMYLAKARHYQQKGVDRRIQQAAYNALCDSYAKILKVNLTDDCFEVIRTESSEMEARKGFGSERFSTWAADYAVAGQVHPEDTQAYSAGLDLDSLRQFFAAGNKRFCIRYRRLYKGVFRMIMLEMMPAPNYADDKQVVFLYAKVLDD